MKNELPKNWSYAEFHAFTLFYAANADGHTTLEEIALIRPTLTEEQYLAVESAFIKSSDSEALNHILGYRDRYFSTPADRERLLADMQAIFKADRVFSVMERNLERIFQRMI